MEGLIDLEKAESLYSSPGTDTGDFAFCLSPPKSQTGQKLSLDIWSTSLFFRKR